MLTMTADSKPSRKLPPVCVNCGQERKRLRRRLCWRCHADPTIRRHYPAKPGGPKSIGARKHEFNGDAAPSVVPSQALAGTLGRITDYALRAKNSLALWNPRDKCIDRAAEARLLLKELHAVESFAERLHLVMRWRGADVELLAEWSGVDANTIRRVLRPGHDLMNETAVKLARGLRVTLSVLVGDAGDKV
jgi:hypothetical protein